MGITRTIFKPVVLYVQDQRTLPGATGILGRTGTGVGATSSFTTTSVVPKSKLYDAEY